MSESEDWIVKASGPRSKPEEWPRAGSGNGARAGHTAPGADGQRAAEEQWLPAAEGPRSAGAKPSPGRNGRSRNRRRSRRIGLLRGGREAEVYKRRAEALELRARELEEELRKERRRSKAKLAKLRTEFHSGPELPQGKLNVNTATFEQLRAVGFSVTQSAKLIGRREQNGRFRTKAELYKTPGLSEAARRTVRQRLRVGRS